MPNDARDNLSCRPPFFDPWNNQKLTLLLDKAIRIRLDGISMSKVVDTVLIHELGCQDWLTILDDLIDIFASSDNLRTIICGNNRQALNANGVSVGSDSYDEVCVGESDFGYFKKLNVS